MKNIFFILLGVFPSFLHVSLRRLIGQKIGASSKIRFGTILLSKKVEIGNNTVLGPFTFINSEEFVAGNDVRIKPLSILKTRIIQLGSYVQIAPLSVINSEFTINSNIRIGDHSRIFPFCWIEPGEGIQIGKHCGVGGHTLMFTHGVWANYLEGGPISYGPIILKDNVWLPWRVFILPNVTIHENVIIGANSLINKSIGPNTLAAGNPAKILKELNYDKRPEVMISRFEEILKRFSEYILFKDKIKSMFLEDRLIIGNRSFILNSIENHKPEDLVISVVSLTKSKELHNRINFLDYQNLTIHYKSPDNLIETFISFLRRFGVRLYVNKH